MVKHVINVPLQYRFIVLLIHREKMYTGLELKSCTYIKTSETGKIMFELPEKQD